MFQIYTTQFYYSRCTLFQAPEKNLKFHQGSQPLHWINEIERFAFLLLSHGIFFRVELFGTTSVIEIVKLRENEKRRQQSIPRTKEELQS